MKGISEVISAVIVLAVGVAVLSLYAEWAPHFAEDTTESIAEQSDQKIKCNNAAISVSDALYDRTGEIVEFKVENTGTIRLAKGVYAGAFASSLEKDRTVISELGVGEIQTVRLESDSPPDSILVTSRDCPDVAARETGIEVQK